MCLDYLLATAIYSTDEITTTANAQTQIVGQNRRRIGIHFSTLNNGVSEKLSIGQLAGCSSGETMARIIQLNSTINMWIIDCKRYPLELIQNAWFYTDSTSPNKLTWTEIIATVDPYDYLAKYLGK